jgi:hypothetical protein
MPTEISPKALMRARENGTKRLQNARAARLMFLRQYVGQYYDADRGAIGTEPLNLIFNAIRVLVPNLIFNFPVHKVTTKFAMQRNYAEMLGLALTQQDKQLRTKETYKQWIIDAIFQIGILKTGLCDSGSSIELMPDVRVDPGTIFTENVDLDNFVMDPDCHKLEEATFLGDGMDVSRQMLLDSGLYRNDLIEKLPSIDDMDGTNRDRAERLSSSALTDSERGELEDKVRIYELWVPRAKAIVTVPGAKDFSVDDFLRVHDYYGPDDGP